MFYLLNKLTRKLLLCSTLLRFILLYFWIGDQIQATTGDYGKLLALQEVLEPQLSYMCHVSKTQIHMDAVCICVCR